MPIVFEAPQPFSASIAAGYGAAEQQSRDLPTIVGAQLQGAQIAAHANQAAADNQYRGAAALGQQRVQASEAEAQREAQARDFDLRRQVATEQANNQRFNQSLQLAEYQRAPEMQQRQFELRAELANAEMTQQENLRLKQLQEYQGAIDGDNSLSPEEKADLKVQVQAKVSPLAAKKARTEMLLAQQHAEEFKQQALQREQVTRMNAALDAKSLADRVTEIDMGDGTTAKLVQTGYDQNGRPTYTQIKAEPKGKAEKPVTRFGDEHGIFSFSLAEKEAKAEAEKAYPKDKDAMDPANAGRRADQFQKVMERFQAEHARQYGTAAAPGAPAEQTRGVPAAVVDAGKQKYDAALAAINTSPTIPQGMKAQAVLATEHLKQVFETYGTTDPNRVPPDARDAVQSATTILQGAAAMLPAPRRSPLPRWLGYNPALDSALGRR